MVRDGNMRDGNMVRDGIMAREMNILVIISMRK